MTVDRIYFDLDGVLADFDRGIRELCGIEPRSQDACPEGYEADKMWEAVKSIGHFYDRLHLMPGAKELFDTVYSEYPDRCEILSAVPRPERGIVTAGDDKISWVRRMLSEDVKINIVLRKDKQDFCSGSSSILIDDLRSNIRKWNEHGGTGILHISSEDTLAELKELEVLPDTDTAQRQEQI